MRPCRPEPFYSYIQTFLSAVVVYCIICKCLSRRFHLPLVIGERCVRLPATLLPILQRRVSNTFRGSRARPILLPRSRFGTHWREHLNHQALSSTTLDWVDFIHNLYGSSSHVARRHAATSRRRYPCRRRFQRGDDLLLHLLPCIGSITHRPKRVRASILWFLPIACRCE